MIYQDGISSLLFKALLNRPARAPFSLDDQPGHTQIKARCLKVSTAWFEHFISIDLILHIRCASNPSDRPMALTADLGTTFGTTSKLHRPTALANSELEWLVYVPPNFWKNLLDVRFRSCTSAHYDWRYHRGHSP